MSTFTSPLTTAETSKFDVLLAQATIKSQSDVARIKNEYRKCKVKEMVAGGTPEKVAKAIVESRMDHILQPEDNLQFDNGSVVTVAEVLEHPEKYNEKTLADPLEPEKGKGKAKFYANTKTGNPVINSFVHGGIVYKLVSNAYKTFNMQQASGMVKGKFRIARKENNQLTFVTKNDLINHYAGVSPDGS